MAQHRRRIAFLWMFTLLGPAAAQSQNRGVYPLGMSATSSGVTPESGFSYAHQLLFYARDESKGPDGELLATGSNAVILDMNSLVWVSKNEVVGGARFSMSATLPITNNSLASDIAGPISGGGGFADSYYQPFILGWESGHAAIRAVYGFLAPTGDFAPGGVRNAGSGYWTNALSSGQTFFVGRDKTTTFSAFQMYEFHTTQKGTGIHPGQTLDLDYSVMRTVMSREDMALQVGIAGYNQWQTTKRTGPGLASEQSNDRYRVNALGVASTVSWPERRVSLGLKYFKEFENRSTFEGFSTQISCAIGF
jgi:hypothetical protein